MTTRKATAKQDPKTILPKVAETLTSKPTSLDIDVKPKNKLHAWLIKNKICKAKRHYEIKPQRVVNIFRIAGRAVVIDPGELFTSADRIGTMMDVLTRHADDIFYIVACAIQNDHREPTNKLIDIVKNEFEMSDLLTVLEIAVSNYNIGAFLNTIVLIKGVDALESKTSPEEKAE